MQGIRYEYMESPVGRLLLAAGSEGLKRVAFCMGDERIMPQRDWLPAEGQLEETLRQLEAYFDGKLRTFDLPLAAEGTAFQKAVWRELLKVPYAETITYGELARRVGNPRAARAVGAANGRNPLAIVVPCHRVIGSNGGLTGYGGGLATKEFLISLERRNAPPADAGGPQGTLPGLAV